jgi:DNA-binding NarL/FixJ family response regulator
MSFVDKRDISILIVEDHWIAAAGLSALLRANQTDMNIVICQTLAETHNHLSSRDPTFRLVIADFWLSDGTALDLLAALTDRVPPINVIVLSGDTHPDLARKANEQGAWAFCAKTAPAEELAELVGRALQGHQAPLGEERSCLSSPINWSHADLTKNRLVVLSTQELGVTRRQGDILRQVLSGRANKVIANALSISEQTVKEHVSALLAKFSVDNRIALIRHFADRRLTLAPSGNQSN